MTLIEILRKRAECQAATPDLPRLVIREMILSFDDAGRLRIEFNDATFFEASPGEAAQLTNWFADLASSATAHPPPEPDVEFKPEPIKDGGFNRPVSSGANSSDRSAVR
jgi:hypothetical protein